MTRRRGYPFELLYCAGVLGRDPVLRWDRSKDAAREASAVSIAKLVELGLLEPGEPVPQVSKKSRKAGAPGLLFAAYETLPPASKKGSLSGDARGQKTWEGVGRGQGYAACALLEEGELSCAPLPIENQLWTRQLSGIVAPKKQGKGEHRVEEVGFLCGPGAVELLRHVPSARLIDVAEAALIACGALYALTRRQGHGPYVAIGVDPGASAGFAAVLRLS